MRWSQYDMHHVLWEPRLGATRFFELYCETWRRSILNLSGDKSLLDWARQVRPRDVPLLRRRKIAREIRKRFGRFPVALRFRREAWRYSELCGTGANQKLNKPIVRHSRLCETKN